MRRHIGDWQEDALGRISEPYLSHWAPSDERLRRGNPVYRELMDEGRVNAALPDGRVVTLMHQRAIAGLHVYSLYELDQPRPVAGYNGLILSRERVWEWTVGMHLPGPRRAEKGTGIVAKDTREQVTTGSADKIPSLAVGRIVHYTAFNGTCLAALVTAHEERAADLAVFTSMRNVAGKKNGGVQFHFDVEHSDDATPGTWHWPERA